MATIKSIEEKAKAYDERLAKARKEYSIHEANNAIGIMDALERVFPELKESEDERIRKRIIHALHGDVLEMSEIREAVAWLEKQGEQDIDISSFSKEQQVFMRKYVSLDKIILIKLLAERDANNAKIIESFEKQGEQKPAEWSDKDKQMIQALNNCIEELENTNGWNYVYVDGCNGSEDIRIETLKNWLKSLKERMKEE